VRRRLLTLGGRTPLPVGALLALAALATAAGTVSPPLGRWLILQVPEPGTPVAAVASEPWRLVTWSFFQGPLPSSLLSLLFGGFLLARLGGELARAWGPRRLLWWCLALSAGGGGLSLLVLAPFGWPVGWFGLWPVVNALVVSWGLAFPRRPLGWLGLAQVRGGVAAWAVTVATPLWAVLLGPAALPVGGRLLLYLPNLVALALAWTWGLAPGGPDRQLTAT